MHTTLITLFLSLCVRLTILQIGTHLKIVPNRYHSHHCNTTDCFFYLIVCATKKVPNRYISHNLRYIFDIFHARPLEKKEPTDFCTYLVRFWYSIVTHFSVQCAKAFKHMSHQTISHRL